MLTQYNTLYHISLRHAFFADQVAKDLVLEPTPATRRVMRQYDLLTKTEAGICRLIYGTVAGQAPPISYLNDDLQLRFILRNSNPFFQHITDLPFFNTQLQRLYFHNLRTAAAEGAETALSAEQTVSGRDLITADNSMRRPPFSPSDLGVVDFYISPDDVAALGVSGADPVAKPPVTRYHLSFAARATRWRYNVVNKSRLPYDRMDVLDGRKLLDFRTGESRALQGVDYEAVPLYSESTFVLQEYQAVKLKLKLSASNGNGGATDLGMPIDLPTPDWRRVSAEGPPDEPQLYSDMYVFL
jgi:hypothetical protein